MAEYIDRTLLEPDTEWSDYDDDFISYSKSQINSLPTADVIEREIINKAIEGMERIIRDTSYFYTSEGVKLALEILKRNIEE